MIESHHLSWWFDSNHVLLASGGIVIGLIIYFFISVFIYLRRRSPKRPIVTSIFDTLCYIPYNLQLFKWGRGNGIHSCLQIAIQATGLVNLGQIMNNDHDFLERYAVARQLGLARSRAEYTPFGYLFTQVTLTRRLTTRLHFMDYLLKHPRITRIPVKKPIFVIGFTRTGTTFLHELLGLHPSVKMHYTWQQMDPVPKTDVESFAEVQKDLKNRFKSNRTMFNVMMGLCGGNIQRVHRIVYDEPEECTIPLAFDLPWHATEIPW